MMACTMSFAIRSAFEQRNEAELDKLLIQSCLENMTNYQFPDGLDIFHISCTRPNTEVVNYYLEKSHVNSQISFPHANAGLTPLHIAVEYGHLEIAKLLLDHGADIYNKDNPTQSTPIHLACMKRNVAMMDLLLLAKYDPWRDDAVNAYGLTHFMAACMGSSLQTVQQFLYTSDDKDFLYDHESNLSLVSSQVSKKEGCPFAGYTPLHFTALYGRRETAELLVMIGANCHIMDGNGIRPIRLAAISKNPTVAKIIMDGDKRMDRGSKRSLSQMQEEWFTSATYADKRKSQRNV